MIQNIVLGVFRILSSTILLFTYTLAAGRMK